MANAPNVNDVNTTGLPAEDQNSINQLMAAFKEATQMASDVLIISTKGNAQLDAAKTRPQG